MKHKSHFYLFTAVPALKKNKIGNKNGYKNHLGRDLPLSQ